MGEKPVINETWKWDFPDVSSLSRNRPRHGKNEKPEDAEDAAYAEKEIAENNKLDSGLSLYRKERWEDALKEFLLIDTSGFSSEERAELAYYLGLCCTKLERFDEAPLYFEQVITIGGNPIRVYQCRMILAYVYIASGRVKMAETELNHLQGSGLESAMLYNTMAYAAYAQKRYLSAVELYEKALDIDKDNLTALNSLGYILADTGLDKFKGLRLCRKAVEKNSRNAAYLDSLGWASYKCGKLKEARSLLRHAVNIAPQEEEIKDHFRIVTGEAV